MKLTMKLFGQAKVFLMGRFNGSEAVSLDRLSVHSNRHPVATILSLRGDSLWKVMVPKLELLFVLGVLCGSCQAQVGPTVVERITVDMIREKPFWNLYTHKMEYNSVDSVHLRLVQPAKFNNTISRLGSSLVVVGLYTSFRASTLSIESSPCVIPFKVASWSDLPEQVSCFRIVGEAILHELPRWETFRQFHNQLRGYGIRRTGSTNSQYAAFVPSSVTNVNPFN